MRICGYVYMDFKKRALECSRNRGDITVDWTFGGPSCAYSYRTNSTNGLQEVRSNVIKYCPNNGISRVENVGDLMTT